MFKKFISIIFILLLANQIIPISSISDIVDDQVTNIIAEEINEHETAKSSGNNINEIEESRVAYLIPNYWFQIKCEHITTHVFFNMDEIIISRNYINELIKPPIFI